MRRHFPIDHKTFTALLGLLLVTGCKCGTAVNEGATKEPEPLATADGTWRGEASSCRNLEPTCGSSKSDCCESLRVPGGKFTRTYDGVDFLDPKYTATVSDFYLDKYEVTVRRFRVFVSAGRGTQERPPGKDAGAHPKISGSGWDPAWNGKLPRDADALRANLQCHAHYQSWTDTPEANEEKPVNCLDWFTAFAFCAWDGGRLPTEAEWNYAASGGSEQRYYPWSSPPHSTTIDDSYAVYCGGTCKLLNVGSKSPKGDAKWGQSDLGGNVWEWTLDFTDGSYPMPCNDCGPMTAAPYRAFRSGSNDDIAGTLRSAVRHIYAPEYRGVVGVRCARNP